MRGHKVSQYALRAVLLGGMVLMNACAYRYERTYPVLTEEEELSALPCQSDGKGGFLGTRLWSSKEATEYCTLRQQPQVGINGLQTCPNRIIVNVLMKLCFRISLVRNRCRLITAICLLPKLRKVLCLFIR